MVQAETQFPAALFMLLPSADSSSMRRYSCLYPYIRLYCSPATILYLRLSQDFVRPRNASISPVMRLAQLCVGITHAERGNLTGADRPRPAPLRGHLRRWRRSRLCKFSMSALGGTHSAALTPTSMDSAAVADRAGPDRRIMTVLATFELDHVQHGVDTGANPTRASE